MAFPNQLIVQLRYSELNHHKINSKTSGKNKTPKCVFSIKISDKLFEIWCYLYIWGETESFNHNLIRRNSLSFMCFPSLLGSSSIFLCSWKFSSSTLFWAKTLITDSAGPAQRGRKKKVKRPITPTLQPWKCFVKTF